MDAITLWESLLIGAAAGDFDFVRTPVESSLLVNSTPNDRARGQLWPIFDNETDLALIRGQARILEHASGMAGGAILGNLRSYVFGSGFTLDCQPPEGEKSPLASRCRDLLHEIFEVNDWDERLADIDQQSRVDGDYLLTIAFPRDGARSPKLRGATAEYLREPGDPAPTFAALEAPVGLLSFGVATPHGDLESHLGYHVAWDGGLSDTQVFPALDGTCAAVRAAWSCDSGVGLLFKRNTPRAVKRGLTDFYPVLTEILDDKKVVRNVQRSAALQAAIAWIEEYAAGVTPQQAAGDNAKSVSGEDGTVRRLLQGGAVVKVGAGKAYKPGPGAERVSGFDLAAQLGARRAGSRWQMPEFMVSGDAGNANYASTVVAEAPFTKARERDQRWIAKKYEQVAWQLLAWAVEVGLFSPYGVTSLPALRKQVTVVITPPAISSTDPLKDAQAKSLQVEAGAMSADTWAAEQGLDPDVERDQGATPQRRPLEETRRRLRESLRAWSHYP